MPTDSSTAPPDLMPGAAAEDLPADGERLPEQHNSGDRQKEIGGRGGLDPTRYGDWEKNGRCIDF